MLRRENNAHTEKGGRQHLMAETRSVHRNWIYTLRRGGCGKRVLQQVRFSFRDGITVVSNEADFVTKLGQHKMA